jgi:hypothetical protein
MTEQRHRERHLESAFERPSILPSRTRNVDPAFAWLGTDPHDDEPVRFERLVFEKSHVVDAVEVDTGHWRVSEGHVPPSPKTFFFLDRDVVLTGSYKATLRNLTTVLRGRAQLEYPPLEWTEAASGIAASVASEELARNFATLAVEWANATILMSSLEQTVLHPAYQQIIGLGPDALPLILQELERSPAYWFWALASIAREDAAADAADFDEARDLWLEWGREKGYLRRER